MPESKVITIDGPAGSGKSTVAARLAEGLGWRLLDTGAMFRAVTLAAIRQGVDLSSDHELGSLVDQIEVLLPVGRILLDGEDVSTDIRSIEVTKATRHSADSPRVRRRLAEWQRAFADLEGEVITEGRDQGTLVFPDAFRKFYLTASNEERAKRRHAEFQARGLDVSLEDVLSDLLERDEQDAERAIAPMRPAPDAILIDCTGLRIEEVVESLREHILRSTVPAAEFPPRSPQ